MGNPNDELAHVYLVAASPASTRGHAWEYGGAIGADYELRHANLKAVNRTVEELFDDGRWFVASERLDCVKPSHDSGEDVGEEVESCVSCPGNSSLIEERADS